VYGRRRQGKSFLLRALVSAAGEFPYLTRKSPELPSVIQTAYDASQSGEHPSSALILCGSALSVMSGVLSG